MVDIVMKEWPDKRVSERFTNGADWSDLLDTDTIASCTATVISGNVTIISGNTFNAGIQAVRIEGGEPGVAVIRCSITTTTNNDIYTQDYKFGILPD